MYPFRNSTWHSLVASMLLLLMIAAATAAPMDPERTGSLEAEAEDSRPVKKPKKSYHPPPVVEKYSLFMSLPLWKTSLDEKTQTLSHIDQTAVLSVGWKPVNEIPKSIRVYRTKRDLETLWKLDDSRGQSSNGVFTTTITASNQYFLEIGTVSMTQRIKWDVIKYLGEEIKSRRLGELPSLLSIYEFLILLEGFFRQAKYKATTEPEIYISETSAFKKAFDEMIEKRGTGAGEVVTTEEMPWEWELYNRIQDGKNRGVDVVRDSLADNNQGFFKLRDQIVGVMPPAVAQDSLKKKSKQSKKDSRPPTNPLPHPNPRLLVPRPLPNLASPSNPLPPTNPLLPPNLPSATGQEPWDGLFDWSEAAQ
ncbi:hypothetical protein C8R42DRAFT_293925 [Lentinula raphanica]|nr:hypothetical protein C8R42DRAFT_293925 [Lentinula raphanica]